MLGARVLYKQATQQLFDFESHLYIRLPCGRLVSVNVYERDFK